MVFSSNPRILTPGDPPAFSTYNESGSAPVLIVCDHAKADVPRKLNQLGLPQNRLKEHIAVDMGALKASKALADLINAPLIYSNYSRLVIDCNRYPGDEASIVNVSDGIRIPGNATATLEDRQDRVREIFHPYHAALSARIESFLEFGTIPALLLIHSCTPQLNGGRPRIWDIGILWALDGRLAIPAMEYLNATGDYVVGNNEPYHLDLGVDYTASEHALRRGLPHLEVEFRQDHLNKQGGPEKWANILYDSLKPTLSHKNLFQIERHWPTLTS
ncbi:MAG: N-formylglutamate amidohydrolase [Pseudomonadota bacterium]